MKIRGQQILDPKKRLRSLSKVNMDTECWEWQSSFKGRGKLKRYGSLIVGSRTNGTRRSVSAHRYSWEVFNGAIPKGKWVLHRCDNPACINPKHLFLGDRQANVDDRESKGRNKIPALKGERHPNAKLTWKKVRSIRNLWENDSPTRFIAGLFKVSPRTVRDIVNFKTWKLPAPPKEDK